MMILYNFRHRGPYEYDKFALNILQLHNEVMLLEQRLVEGSASELAVTTKEFNGSFDLLTNEGSLSQEMLLLAYQFE